MKKGELVVVSGFSGVGKGTVIKRLRASYPEYHYSVSATTRAPREGEVDGRDYFFLTPETFAQWVSEGRFLEYASYAGRSYGTPREYVERQRAMGFHILMDIETDGAFHVKEAVPEAKMIYLIPPSAEELVRRLCGRGTETQEQVRARLEQALREAELVRRYEWVVVNDAVPACAFTLHRIVNEAGRPLLPREEALAKTDEIRRDLEKILNHFPECAKITR